jgi:uncharacterized protein
MLPTAMETPPAPVPPLLTPGRPAENWRLYLELLAFSGFIIPFGQILGPLVLWLIKKDTLPEVDIEGRRVLNFNISWMIWIVISCGFGLIVWLVIAIIASIKAANREPFRHPLTIEFLKPMPPLAQ